MDNLEQGDIIFTSDWSFLGTLVRLNSGGGLFHPALVGHCGIMESEFTMIESAGDGVVRIPFTEVMKRKTNIYVGKLSQSTRNTLNLNIDKFTEFTTMNLGKPYDIGQVVQYFITRNTGLWKAKEDFTKLFCSELVTGYLETVGILNNVDASIKSPEDVFEYKIYDHLVRIK